MRIMIVGGVRGERKFDGIEELRERIGVDVKVSMEFLDSQPAAAFKSDGFIQGGGVGRKGMKGLNGGEEEDFEVSKGGEEEGFTRRDR